MHPRLLLAVTLCAVSCAHEGLLRLDAAAPVLTMQDYEFIAPARWRTQRLADQILLTQSSEPGACKIQLLPPQASTGDLEQDVKAVFGLMYPGWSFARTGEQQQVLSRGFLPQGLEYCMMEAQMSATDANGRYHLEDGVALVVRAGAAIAIIVARHGGLMAHTDCLNQYETWRRFFNSFTVKHAPLPKRDESNVPSRLIGVWAQSGGRALAEYAFAANGHYAFSGALGTSWTTTDANYEYLHLRTHAFEGDGTYALPGDTLSLTKHRGGEEEKARFRFEEVNRGGTGWKDRLWLLKQDKSGEVEVPYDRKGAPAATGSAPAATLPPATSTSAAPPSRRGPALPEAAEVAGLYQAAKQVYDANPYGAPGTGMHRTRMYYYLLSSDGRVFRGMNLPDVPDGDIENFDFDAAKRASPKDAGTYRVKGDEVILTLGDAPHKVTVAPRSRDRLQINDPEFTYANLTFTRSLRALPPTSADLAPTKRPEVVRIAAAALPATIQGLPTLVYQAPPGFRDPTGFGRHESIATGQARVEVYDFRPFSGKNFEREFRATRFRDWLAETSREEDGKVVGDPVFETPTWEGGGVDQIFSVTFLDASEALREVIDTDAPRARTRFALFSSGAVALVDMVLRDSDAFQQQQASLDAFGRSLQVLPAPPPMSREEILAIAGDWEWDRNPGFGRDAIPHDAQARKESYVFSLDGRVAWSEGGPAVDFRSPPDFDRLGAEVAHAVGTYFKRGDQYVMRFGAPPYYVYLANIKDTDTLEILGYTYHRKKRGEP